MLLQAIRDLPARSLRGSANETAASGTIRTASQRARLLVARGAATLLLVGAATLVISAFDGILPFLNIVSIVYLLPVIVTAMLWGIWPAILAAIAGAGAADFFFYPPIYSFRIEDSQNIADLVAFVTVALVAGSLSSTLRRREREINELYDYSKRLAACSTTADLVSATQRHLSAHLNRATVLLDAKSVDDEYLINSAVPKFIRHKTSITIARNDRTTHTVVDQATQHIWLVRRLSFGPMEYVVFVDLGSQAYRKHRTIRHIDEVLSDTADNLTRLDLAEAIEEFRVQAQSDKLKSALVATMSHELRNPLVSILGAASVLNQMTEVANSNRARSLVETVYIEAARLDGNIKNLVDTARITTDARRPDPELTDPVDIVRAAVDQKKGPLARYDLEVVLGSDLPLVRVQPALVENALAQLIDNAIKYSPANSKIAVRGTADAKWLVLSVSDQGAGLTADERTHVGQRSFRSARHTALIRGSGLGLWIANTFVVANGGKLEAESPGPGLGSTVRIYLPVAQEWPPARGVD